MTAPDRSRIDFPMSPILLEGIDLACYRGEIALFEHLDLRVEAQEALRIEGANGAGKTSLLRILAGLSRPDEGRVEWSGTDIHLRPLGFNAVLGFLGHLLGLKQDLSIEENLRMMMALRGQQPDRLALIRALDQVGLSDRSDLHVRQLSQGQRQRTALAALMLSGSLIWILDEPFTALDRTGIALVESLLDRHLDQGGMAILTSHQSVSTRHRVRSLEL
ncbi:MAG: hypothetical protein RLZ25_1413 [Pseudomonadota bacterium]